MDGNVAPLLLFAFVMSFTPGPNVVLVTASAANFGFRRAVPQILGIALGFGVMVAVVGLGLAAVFRAEPRMHTILKYAGGAYLAWLAWRIARAGAMPRDSAPPKLIGFVEALLFQWINAKGWIFALGAFSTYTSAGNSVVRETALIATVLATTCLLSVAAWGAFGSFIGRFLRNTRARTAFNGAMAILLVVSLVPAFA